MGYTATAITDQNQQNVQFSSVHLQYGVSSLFGFVRATSILMVK